MRRYGKRKRPSASVVASTVTLVAVWRALTCAPGTVRPCGSRTRPLMVARLIVSCAAAMLAVARHAARTPASRRAMGAMGPGTSTDDALDADDGGVARARGPGHHERIVARRDRRIRPGTEHLRLGGLAQRLRHDAARAVG